MDWHGYSAFQEAQRNYLEHYGVKGMRWRNRKGPNVRGAIHNVTSYVNSQTRPKNNVSNETNAASSHYGVTASNAQNVANVSYATETNVAQVKPDSSYKEAKKSKRFSFFSNILSKLKKLLG